MRSLDALVDTDDPGISRLAAFAEESPHRVDVLPPGEGAADCLLALQVTTRSMLGTVAYRTGGLLVADGWLRVLGAGSPALPRRLDAWNGLGAERRHAGGLLVADDAGGGFFSWQADTRTVAYYDGLRWDGWRFLASELTSSQAMFFYPPRFTEEGRDPIESYRGLVPVEESWDVQQDLARQLAEGRAARSG